MDIKTTEFTVVDREILKGLLGVKFRRWYYYHKKYLLSPGQLARSFKKLQKLDLVIIEDDKISIKDEATAIIIKYRNKIFRTNKNENWRKVPEDMLISNNK